MSHRGYQFDDSSESQVEVGDMNMRDQREPTVSSSWMKSRLVGVVTLIVAVASVALLVTNGGVFSGSAEKQISSSDTPTSSTDGRL